MAKILFEHKCEHCDHVTVVWCEYEEKLQSCEKCGGPAYRIISAVPWGNENAMGVDGDYPGAAMKWEQDTVRRHRQAGQAHHGKNPPKSD